MAYNKKKSYFAEQREANSNPNFFNNVDPSVLRNNVRRIIRDVADDLIIDTDYIYFKNERVINACIQESYENWQSCQVIARALNAYRSVVLPQRLVGPYVDVQQDMYLATNELSAYSSREAAWCMANNIFVDISKGADPKESLVYLTRVPKGTLKSL